MSGQIDLSPNAVKLRAATRNTQRALDRAQEMFLRMGLIEMTKPENEVLGHMTWVLWVPVVWQLLNRIEALEAKVAEKQ